MRRTMAVIGFVLFITQWVLCTLGFGGVFWIAGAAVLVFLAAVFVPKLRQTVLLCSLLSVLAGCLLFYTAYAKQYAPLQAYDGQRVEICGHASDIVQRTSRGQRIEIAMDSVQGRACSGKLILYTDRFPDMDLSDEIVFSARFRSIALNKASGGALASAYCVGSKIRVIPHAATFQSRMLAARLYTYRTIQSAVPGISGRVLASLLTGDASQIPQNVYLTLRGSGVLHLFAVSGFHLSVFSMALIRLFSRRRYPPRSVTMISCLIVFFVMAVTGFSYSCVRAGIMLLIVLGGFLFHWQADSINSLGFALLCLGMIDPFCAGDVGLQLSVLGVLCLILVTPYADRIVRHIRFRPRKLAGMLRNACSVALVSAAIGIVTMPITLQVFRQFSQFSPLVNALILVPAQTAMIVAAVVVLCSLLSPLRFLGRLSGLLSGVLTRYCVWICGIFGRHALSVPKEAVRAFALWAAGTLIVCAVSIWIRLPVRRRIGMVGAVSVFIFSVCGAGVLHTTRSAVKITIPDIGNSAAVLLQSDGESALLGCGQGIYARALAPLVNRLDFVWIPDYRPELAAGFAQIQHSFAIAHLDRPTLQGTPVLHRQRIGSIDLTCFSDANCSAAFARMHTRSVLFLFSAGKLSCALPQDWYGADIVWMRGGLPHGWQPELTGLMLFSAGADRAVRLINYVQSCGGAAAATGGDGDLCLQIAPDGAIRLEKGS